MLYHINQVEGDEPYIDAQIASAVDIQDRYEPDDLLTEQALQATPELRKALEDWQQGERRVLVRSECKWFLTTIKEAGEIDSMGAIAREKPHPQLLEEAAGYPDEPACRSAIHVAALAQQLAEAMKVAPLGRWPKKENAAVAS